MASSVSIANNYNGSTFKFTNKDLLLKSLMMKQGQYDTNVARLQNAVDQIAVFDVAKQQDQDYINQRLDQTLSIVNKYTNQYDMSDPNLSTQLIGKMEEVVDDKVLNAVSSTAIRRREESTWKAAREKNDGTYSDLNFMYQKQNWDSYLNNDKVGDVYSGNGGFVKYVDVNKIYTSKEFTQYLKDNNINAEYIQSGEGTGYFNRINTMNGTMDEQRLQQAIQAFGGQEASRQIGINAWGQYGNGDNPEAVERFRVDYETYRTDKLNGGKERLSAIDKLMSDPNTPQGSKVRLQAEKESIQKGVSTLSDNSFENVVMRGTEPDKAAYKNLYTQYYANKTNEDLFALSYTTPYVTDTQIDDVQYKTKLFELNEKEFALSQQKFQLDVLREQRLSGLNPDGTTTTSTANVIQDVARTGGAGEDGNLSDKQVFEAAAKEWTDAQASVRNYVPEGLTDSEMNQLMTTLTTSEDPFGGNSTIRVGNKEIPVNPSTISSLLRLKNTAMGEGGLTKVTSDFLAGEALDKSLDVTIGSMYNVPEVEYNASKTSNFYYKPIGNGQYEFTTGAMPGMEKEGAKSNYEYLLKKAKILGKDRLLPEEAGTLLAYQSQQLLVNDESLQDFDKKALYQGFLQRTKNLLGTKAANTTPTYTSAISTGYSSPIREYDNLNSTRFINYSTGSIGNVIGKESFFESTSGAIFGDNVNSTLVHKENKKLLDETRKNIVDNIAVQSKRGIKIVSGGAEAEQLKKILPNVASTYKGDFSIERSDSDPNLVNVFKVYEDNVKDENKNTVTKTFKEPLLGEDGKTQVSIPVSTLPKTINLAPTEKTPWDVTSPNPQILSLGKSAYLKGSAGDITNVKVSDAASSLYDNMSRSILTGKTNLNEAQRNALKADVDKKIADYKAGQVEFNLAPINNQSTYGVVVKLSDGLTVPVQDTKLKRLQYEDVAMYYNNLQGNKEQLFANYLRNYIDAW